jgi:hypothetical protein
MINAILRLSVATEVPLRVYVVNEIRSKLSQLSQVGRRALAERHRERIMPGLVYTTSRSMPVLTFNRKFSMRVHVTERSAKRHRNDARAKSVVPRPGRDLGKVGIHQRKRPSANEQKQMLFSPSGRRYGDETL